MLHFEALGSSVIPGRKTLKFHANHLLNPTLRLDLLCRRQRADGGVCTQLLVLGIEDTGLSVKNHLFLLLDARAVDRNVGLLQLHVLSPVATKAVDGDMRLDIERDDIALDSFNLNRDHLGKSDLTSSGIRSLLTGAPSSSSIESGAL